MSPSKVTPREQPGPAVATIGVDIGGTKCLGVVVDIAGAVVAEHRLPTPRAGSSLVATVAAVVTELRVALGGARLSVGVGAPGLVDGRGVLRFAPNLPGVRELPLRDRLLADLLATPRPNLSAKADLLTEADLPAKADLLTEAEYDPCAGDPQTERSSGTREPDGVQVRVDNDATCAAWAETVLGAAAGRSHVLLATIGTGIGGGLISDGRLVRGRHGFAGEIGHMVVDSRGPRCPCGQQGCWERYASGTGLGWMAREAAQAGMAERVVELAGGDPEAVRGEHVTVAAGEGDSEARAVMARFAWWLALGLANLANVLDPEMIVLGGGMVESGAVLLEPVEQAFAGLLEGAPHRPLVPIVAARLGERAGAVGAALLARG